MSTSDAQPYHHGDLKAALLRSAEALLSEGGEGAVSLREAARRSGVSAAATYRHYANKEALLAAIAAHGFEDLEAALRAAAESPDNPLLEMAIAYVEFAVAGPARFHLMFGPTISERDRYPELADAARRSFDALRDALGTSEPGGGDREEAAVAAWALVHGLSALIIDGALAGDDIPGRVRSVLEARARLSS